MTGCSFKDERLRKRFGALLSQMGTGIGGSIPLACQDWANTKAAYRFLSNNRVTEADILAGHFRSTCERFTATDGPVLVLHDTTEFSYQRAAWQHGHLARPLASQRHRLGSRTCG